MLTRLLQTELVSLTAALSVTLNGIALVYHWTPETVGVINGILAAWLLVVRQAVTPNVTADATPPPQSGWRRSRPMTEMVELALIAAGASGLSSGAVVIVAVLAQNRVLVPKLDHITVLTNSTLTAANKRIDDLEVEVETLKAERAANRRQE